MMWGKKNDTATTPKKYYQAPADMIAGIFEHNADRDMVPVFFENSFRFYPRKSCRKVGDTKYRGVVVGKWELVSGM